VPSISLGTVYNCLETLEQSGLIRTVTHDRDSARFCPNLSEHAHLFCRKCGSVTDIPLRATHADHGVTWEVPERVQIETQVVAFHGLCAECSGQTQVQLHGATTSVSHELEPKHEGS
jgi:Fur family peroxide stress response transcriptional regulator